MGDIWTRRSTWISAAGGVAVLAHPARYRVGELQLHALLHEFREAGGIALEVVTSNHTPDRRAPFAQARARDSDLEASSGSDFHGPGEAENVELGARSTAACGPDAGVAPVLVILRPPLTR